MECSAESGRARLISALLIRRRYALTAVRRETGAAAIHLRRQAPVEA